mmetsp:Transcript_1310/g.3313  ORF Transcript_1310/g.3313 Transcript_1310/m.3313 type:complete len:553 (-) Transcript_1310:16-1674(-)
MASLARGGPVDAIKAPRHTGIVALPLQVPGCRRINAKCPCRSHLRRPRSRELRVHVQPPSSSRESYEAFNTGDEDEETDAEGAADGGGGQREATFPAESEAIWPWRRQFLASVAAFVGPAIFIPLADPLMSVIDTIAVGRFATTTDLAGLGPVTLIFTFVNYIWNSQGVATTTMVATELNEEGVPPERAARRAGRVLAASLLLALCAGGAVCVVLQLAGPTLLAATGASPELIPPALAYLRVRALATPASFCVVVLQASLMAQRLSLLPAGAILASAAINVGLDVLLIAVLGMGTAGAAWATLAAQLLAAGALWALVHAKGRVRPVWHVPSPAELAAFASATGPLAFIYLCKNVCYCGLQRAATGLPTLMLAAHQPAFMLWNLCAFSTVPLEQAALAFVPAAKTPRQRAEVPRLIVVAGLVFALVAGLIAAGIPLLAPQLFSPDARLYPYMREIAPLGFLAMMCVGLEVASTAILISWRKFPFISSAMLRTVLATAAYLAAAGHFGWGLRGVWAGLAVFYGSRAVQSFPQVLREVRAGLGDPPPTDAQLKAA